jgi:mRNA interferase RelE/StbE
MEIFYTSKAAKQLENLPRQIQKRKRIAEKMRFYAKQENPLKFAKRLTDYREGGFRFRIGEYRLIFDVIKNKIYILKIDKRDKIYD